MNRPDENKLCSFVQLSEYLVERGAGYLLEFVEEVGNTVQLNQVKFDSVVLPSVRYEIACMFMLLDQCDISEGIHKLRWHDLGRMGDNIGNDMLKTFMLAYPREL